MKRCDLRDPIFKGISKCASDEEFEKMMLFNHYFYYTDNMVDYNQYDRKINPFFKEN